MSKRMLIDASHPEETRVVIVSGNRVEEFDFESASRKPLKGNIFLAKVTRVEPSLQAAFIEYGGNRHGFLAFSEIHPDYYQIPVADRQALIEAQRAEERSQRYDDDRVEPAPKAAEAAAEIDPLPVIDIEANDAAAVAAAFEEATVAPETLADTPPVEPIYVAPVEPAADSDAESPLTATSEGTAEEGEDDGRESHVEEVVVERVEAEVVSSGDDDAMDEVEPHRPSGRSMRQYKIQEVIKKRQILLIQVVKEERGNKGAALTTYLSLAGRYCVLMPNSGRGGGISRKITNSADRRRLKDAAESLDVPEGMGLIVRTAGASRTKQEIQRDYEYLLRLWDSIRELTLRSTAPALVYEEGNLIKRAIRDQFSRDIEEIVVEGEEGFAEAQAFTKMIMPQQVDSVRQHDGRPPLFQKYKVESQLDSMFNPRVQLKSGGYIVINQTEALVAIDVNSGRSTREHNIEDTAYKTNLEAAEEVARQLRLRDLAGLIVIDFIDMEEGRNDRSVERKLKECLKHDRARIQVGRISPFGLLEMSRQRLRPGMVEGSTVTCPHCNGTGLIRSVESLALRALRQVEEETHNARVEGVTVRLPTEVAVYIFNHKRSDIQAMEDRLGISIYLEAKPDMFGADCEVELGAPGGVRTRRPVSSTAVSAETALSQMPEADFSADEEMPDSAESGDEEDGGESPRGERPTRDGERQPREGERGGRGRRRRGRGRDRDERPRERAEVSLGGAGDPMPVVDQDGDVAQSEPAEEGGPSIEHNAGPEGARDGGERRRRRRGRRGGRRNGRPEGGQPGDINAAEGFDGDQEDGDAELGQQDLAPVAPPVAGEPAAPRPERKSPAAAIARFFGFGPRPESRTEPRAYTAPEAAAADAASEPESPAPKTEPEAEIAAQPVAAAPTPEPAPLAELEPPPPETAPEPAIVVAPPAPEPAPVAASVVDMAEPALNASMLEAEMHLNPPEPAPATAPIVPALPEKVEVVVVGEAPAGPAKAGWWKKRED